MSMDELLEKDAGEENKVNISINPETGQPEGTHRAEGYGFDSDNDLFDDFLGELDDNLDADYTDDHIGKALENEHIEKGSLEDIQLVRDLLTKKNEHGGIKYKDLPEFMKKKVDELVRQELPIGVSMSQIGLMRNMLANEVIENIYSSILQEKFNEITVDLDTSIRNLVKNEVSDITSAQKKQYTLFYTKTMVELANTKYKDDPEKRELLLKVSEGYKQAHSLENMYSAYSKGGKRMKVRKIDIEKINGVIREFEYKYENSTFTLRGNIADAIPILKRHVNARFSENTIKAFIAVFCKYTWAMKPVNVDEHTFMYYFVGNILGLDLPTIDKEVKEYDKEFIENVNHFLALIDEKINKNQ